MDRYNYTSNLKNLNKAYLVLSIFPIGFIIGAFLMDSPINIFNGFIDILNNLDVLLIDYIKIGGLSSALFNSGASTLVILILYRIYGLELNAISITALFVFSGYSFIGKNLINIVPILFGGYLYSVYDKTDFSKILPSAVFSTCLAPAVNMAFQGSSWPFVWRLAFAILVGIFIGFLIHPLASHMPGFHKGFTIYNLGFAAGVLGVFIALFLNILGYKRISQSIFSHDYDIVIRNVMFLYFIYLIIVGFILNGNSFSNYRGILKLSGWKYSSFIEDFGYGLAFIHLGISGLIFMGYVQLVGGVYNGPTIAAIFCATGFALSGKHILNITPILLGTYLVTRLNSFDPLHPSTLMTALLSTALAPISGIYGAISGFLAAAFHMAVNPYVGSLHGGLNLYNAGFSSGIVAMIAVPILELILRKDTEE